jgi:hypothetical protein
MDFPRFDENTRSIAAMVERIQGRGGRVVFVAMPSSGLVRDIDERRFPKELFWNRFITIVKAPAVHFEDVAALSRFTCPDGSHLDMRDQMEFTRALASSVNDAILKAPAGRAPPGGFPYDNRTNRGTALEPYQHHPARQK